MTQPTTTGGYQSTLTTSDLATEFGSLSYLVRTITSRIRTSTLVRVQAVTNDGGLSPIGFVDVLPLVNQLTGAGVAVPHVTIFRCPYLRLQGGGNAVILDPEVGDIGAVIFAERDISSALANKGQSNPGSARRFDRADAIYLGSVVSGTPTQYVQFNEDGIEIVSPKMVKVSAPTVEIDCDDANINATSGVNITTPQVSCTENLSVGNGATGTFTTGAGQVVTVQDGIVTNIF